MQRFETYSKNVYRKYSNSLLAKPSLTCWTTRPCKPRGACCIPNRPRCQLGALTDAQSTLQLALRQSQDAVTVLQLVEEQKQHLNSTLASTAVQMLAHLPKAQVNPDDLTNAVEELAYQAANELESMADPTATLWGFAELNIKSYAVQDLVETFASKCWSQQQHSSPSTGTRQTDQWNTVVWAYTENSDQACKNLVTAAWAVGRLTQYPSPPIVDCMSSIAAELSKKLHNNMLKPAFGPEDLADIVDSFASFRELIQSQSSWGLSFSKRNAGALMDTIATDVRQQMSNMHSMRAPFDPPHLLKLLNGYARMKHFSSSSSAMLDAVAGFVVRRSTAGHLNAVSKPEDVAQLLQAYAALGHSTVVMPELLNAVSNQLRKQLASDQERQSQHNIQAEEMWDDQALKAPLGKSPAPLISVLKAYHNLGYHPSQGLLTAVEPFLTGQTEPLTLQQALDLASVFAAFDWQPGDLALQQVATSLSTAAAEADVKTLSVITSALTHLRMAGYHVSETQLGQLQSKQQELTKLKRSW